MISSVGDFNDELRWGWITVAGDIESVEDLIPVGGRERTLLEDDLSIATCWG